MPPLFPAAALGLALLASAPPAGRPAPAGAFVAASVSGSQAPPQSEASGPEARAASGLPRRAPEPRTMRAYWPVFAALSLSWVGIVGYLLSIGRRSGRVARMLHPLDPDR